jgi:hypothetical protein
MNNNGLPQGAVGYIKRCTPRAWNKAFSSQVPGVAVLSDT